MVAIGSSLTGSCCPGENADTETPPEGDCRPFSLHSEGVRVWTGEQRIDAARAKLTLRLSCHDAAHKVG